MITLKVENNHKSENHPISGDYQYCIRDKDTIVVQGIIEDHTRAKHPIVLLEKVLEDAKAKLHEDRVMQTGKEYFAFSDMEKD